MSLAFASTTNMSSQIAYSL